MMRFARVVSCLAMFVFALAAPGRAQSASTDSRYYAEVNAGATFGHKSSGSVGAEGGYHLTGPYTVFVEGGRMFNVGTSDLDARAQFIANEVGATSSSSYKVNYFDAGIRYVLPPNMKLSMLNPYLAIGFGVASVRAETALAVNGATVPPESLGVAFGADLDGSVTKALLTLGAGVTYPLAQRYFIDGAFRYGRIFPRGGVIEGDKGINTARLQIGFGVSF